MADLNRKIKYRIPGQFITTDATATDIAIPNSIVEDLSNNNDQAIVRVVCRVLVNDIALKESSYDFEVHALYECNSSGYFYFTQIGSANSITHAEPLSSVCTCTLNDDNNVINLQIAGEAGQTFNWVYDAKITAIVID